MSRRAYHFVSKVELVDDVKRMVLDYLSLSADLQALCLTSKSWNPLATEYLYRKIVLDVRACDGQLALFHRCVDMGARKHLVHTRSLSLLNIPRWESGAISPADDPMSEVLRKDFVLQILQALPSDKLGEFRYVAQSNESLNANILGLLQEHQQAIDRLHMSHGSVRQLIYPRMRCVTAGFQGEYEQTHGFVQSALALPVLESLSLLFQEGWSKNVHDYWRGGHHVGAFKDQKIVARILMLEGCMPEAFGSALPQVFDLSRVTKLALLDCKSGLLQHLSSSRELRNLVDFELRTLEHFDDIASENARTLFVRNKSLLHLRLHINGLHSISLDPQDQDPPDTAPYLWPLRPTLKTLSLLDLYREGDNMHFAFPNSYELQHICSQFSALEQLGLSLYDFNISAAVVEERHDYLVQCLGPVGKLKNLRILQLYQDRVSTVRIGRHPSKPRVNIRKIHQEFATRFFQWAHTQCPLLEVLIWGTCEENYHFKAQRVAEDEMKGRDTSYCVVERAPQECFVKKVLELDDGHFQIVAASVTRSQIRDDFPELHILNYDTGRYVEGRLADEAVR
ncbi:hypothetical protein G6011_09859 [Alternaria panax]|uniref:F-box domain-containing protein n=1 Tax=Alternaria panax TaxID=48097 RepID=A0AAD4FCT2_9PLEO|nr:hypothetical protein G6011_09859 [Alternaria panax]